MNEQLAALIEMLPIAIGVADPDGTITAFNREFTRVFGYTIQDVPTLEAWWLEAYPDPAYREQVLAQWNGRLLEAGATGGPVRVAEYLVTCKSGAKRTVSILGATVGGTIYAIFQDQTDIRLAEHRYREQLEFTRAVIDAAADGIAVCHDLDEPPYVRFTVWSKRMEDITGYTIDEINALGWFQSLYPDREVRMAAVARMGRMRQGDDLRAEPWTISDAQGRPRPIAISTSVVPSHDGRTHVLGIVQDRTEVVLAEEERRSFERKLWETQRLEGLGVLAGGIAHDFNNLLVAILGHAELGTSEVGAGTALGRRLDAIRMAAMRAAELTNQLLAYSGKGRFVVQPTDLNALIGEMGELLTTSLPKSVELAIALDDDLPRVMADAVQMRQVVMNLLTNAAEAIQHPDGKVRLFTMVNTLPSGERRAGVGGLVIEAGDFVVVRVEDDGEGMSPETLPRIFDPFFTTKFTGRGLGLAAVLGIVRGHGGCLFVESAVGAGTSVEVWLPAIAMPPDAVDATPAAVSTALDGLRVLVVDDEPAVRLTTRALLEELGLEVLLADSGNAGVARYDAEGGGAIDLVLLDLTMPRGGGEQALRELRQRRADLPVVIMSGYSADEVSARVGRQEHTAFLQKPFTFDSLAGAIAAVVRR